MTGIDASSLLKMRSSIVGQNAALQRAAGHADAATGQTGAASFGQTLTDAVRNVNAQQTKANEISAAYERGDTSDIVQVMLERQKASISFEATLQVRNKLLSAYRDIMNMPV